MGRQALSIRRPGMGARDRTRSAACGVPTSTRVPLPFAARKASTVSRSRAAGSVAAASGPRRAATNARARRKSLASSDSTRSQRVTAAAAPPASAATRRARPPAPRRASAGSRRGRGRVARWRPGSPRAAHSRREPPPRAARMPPNRHRRWRRPRSSCIVAKRCSFISRASRGASGSRSPASSHAAGGMSLRSTGAASAPHVEAIVLPPRRFT